MVAQEVIAADSQIVDTSPVHGADKTNIGNQDVKPEPTHNDIAKDSKPEPITESRLEATKESTQESKQASPVPAAPKKKRRNLQAGVKDAIQLAIFTLVTAFIGGAMRGDWIILLVHILKVWYPEFELSPSSESPGEVSPVKDFWDYFENWHIVVALSVGISFVTYYGLGGYLQYAYYIKRKDQAHEWKCQPTRWLTPENERHEILMGSFNMFLGGSISGLAATWVLNGGPSTMYFSPGEHGYVYLAASTVLVFLFQDGAAYYCHRLGHIPSLYRHIHKHHHRYHSPTAFSASAMHPVEFVLYQCVFASPMFWCPIYSGAFVMLLFYGYYYGMIDHSGIMMDAVWPWQPESLFHDDHHRYFHTNFGFNTKLWDWLHDTLRQDSRVYGEDIFYGKGKTKEE